MAEAVKKGFEAALAAYRVPMAAAVAIVMAASVVVSAGVNPGAESRVTTTGPQVGETAGPAAPADPGAVDPAADPAATAQRARAAVRGATVKKGGFSLTTIDGIPVADLYTAQEDRIGITDTGGKFGKGTITLCGHAATVFGPAFNTAPEDLDVYWRAIDDAGGVHGRNVVTSWEDDVYDPNQAVAAATRCKAKNPFILLGGIGFEQIPAVRNYVEQQHMLYIHHIARSDTSKKYSFAPLPTVERLGTLAGEYVKRTFPNKKIGIIYRDSEFWIPGKDAFEKVVGNQVVARQAVIKNQGSYQAQLLDMQTKGADLVFAWENALAQAAMINEADGFIPPYRPQWIVFPFNLVTDTVGDRALNPTIHGISTWSAYSPGDYGGPFAEYADEIRRFEAAYKKHRDVPLTDIHWMTWLAWKSIHYTLDQCGRECTRNKVVGAMLWKPYGYDITKPSCPLDFTRNGHEGGDHASIFEAYRRPNGSVGFKHRQHCQTGFL
jgi:ABC-type branched-subunit amino acid transport system substrate-binding protein